MITRIVSRIAAILASTAAILTVMAITPVHADSGSVTVSVSVCEGVWFDATGGHSATYSANARDNGNNGWTFDNFTTSALTIDGVTYEIVMVKT